jgi:hypothetical protein
VIKEILRLFSLAAGGLEETPEHSMILQPFVGAGALDGFAHDHDRTQAPLGLVYWSGAHWPGGNRLEAAPVLDRASAGAETRLWGEAVAVYRFSGDFCALFAPRLWPV